jgi:hypothetical protein
MTLVAVCKKTGEHLRPATPEERATYLERNAHRRAPCFYDRVILEDVTIMEDNGPGGWIGHFVFG